MIIAALESYTSLVVCWMICLSVGLSLYLKNSNIYKSSINLPTDILKVAHYGKGYKIPGKIFTFCGYYQLYPNFYLVLEFFYSLLFLCNLIWSQFNVNTQYKYSYKKKKYPHWRKYQMILELLNASNFCSRRLTKIQN